DARVDPPGKESAQRYVGNHAQPNGFTQPMPESFLRFGIRERFFWFIGKVPIPLNTISRLRGPHEQMGGGQLEHTCHKGSWRTDVLKAQVQMNRMGIDD